MSRKYIPVGPDPEEKNKAGFFDFINTLEYYRNAELDNEKPIEDRRILFKKRWEVLGQGVRFGGASTGAVVFLHFLATALAVFAHFSGQNPFAAYLIVIVMDLFHALVKSSIPIWIVSKYYLWSTGITNMYISNFINGFVLASVSISILKALLFFAGAGIVWLFSETSWGRILNELFIFHFWYPLLQLVMILFDLMPLGVLWRYRRKRKFQEKPYHLLDEIPDDEE